MSKVKIIKVLDAITLESTEAGTQAAASRVVVDSYLSEQLNFVVKYTTGAAETSNTCSVKVYGYIGTLTNDLNGTYGSTAVQSDTANWVQIGDFSVTAGVATFTATTFNVVGASAATTYTGHFAFGITFPKLMFTATESGVATNKGTVSITALIS